MQGSRDQASSACHPAYAQALFPAEDGARRDQTCLRRGMYHYDGASGWADGWEVGLGPSGSVHDTFILSLWSHDAFLVMVVLFLSVSVHDTCFRVFKFPSFHFSGFQVFGASIFEFSSFQVFKFRQPHPRGP